MVNDPWPVQVHQPLPSQQAPLHVHMLLEQLPFCLQTCMCAIHAYALSLVSPIFCIPSRFAPPSFPPLLGVKVLEDDGRKGTGEWERGRSTTKGCWLQGGVVGSYL